MSTSNTFHALFMHCRQLPGLTAECQALMQRKQVRVLPAGKAEACMYGALQPPCASLYAIAGTD